MWFHWLLLLTSLEVIFNCEAVMPDTMLGRLLVRDVSGSVFARGTLGYEKRRMVHNGLYSVGVPVIYQYRFTSKWQIFHYRAIYR
jgi:hypothetical protein